MLVLRDFEHLRNAAAAETVTRARLMSLQLLLGNGHHTSKIVTYADGKSVQIGVLGAQNRTAICPFTRPTAKRLCLAELADYSTKPSQLGIAEELQS